MKKMSTPPDLHSRLDELIRRAMIDCAEDLRSAPWFGRENELVNLFVFSHLLRVADSLPGVLAPGQIGIEVAVPQLPDWSKKPKASVRKDLVIWGELRATCWSAPLVHAKPPLAVMEWKTLNNIGVKEGEAGKRREHENDVDWLTRATRRWPEMWGYAVFADLRSRDVTFTWRRVREGRVSERMTIP